MASTFQNPRLAVLPCERMKACSFAENFVTLATMAANHGTLEGTGNSADHGFTTDGSGRVIYDVQAQPGGFSVSVRFLASVRSSPGPLISNMDSNGGFTVSVTATGIEATHYNGVTTPTPCAVTVDYTDGETHTVSYVVDMIGGTHSLYVDALPVDVRATTIDEEIGTGLGICISGGASGDFVGTNLRSRIFDDLLTQADHDAYHADVLTSFLGDPLAVYRCDEVCDDSVGHKILERSIRCRDLWKADRVATAKFPTLHLTPTPRYLFDGIDDYLSNLVDLPSLYTIVAALTSSSNQPYIQQDNDRSSVNTLLAEGGYAGFLNSLSIHDSVLSPLQLSQSEYQHLYWLYREYVWGLYHRLITEDTCQFLMFPGKHPMIYRDLSRNLYMGVATNVTNNGADGVEFLSPDSRITVVDAAPLRSPQGTVVVFGDFAGAEAAGTMCDKGSELRLETNGNQLSFLGSTIAHTFAGNEQIAVAYREGFKPRFYVDGYFIGEGSTEITQSVLIDGDMEAAGVGAWTPMNAAILTKQGGAHEGSQCLKIEYGGVATPYAQQSILTAGKTYWLRGVAESDGVRVPRISVAGVGNIWVGTTSTAWQPFDVVLIAGGTAINFLVNGGANPGEHVKFDDITVIEFDDLIIGNNNAANSPTPYPLTQFYWGDEPLTDAEILGLWDDRRTIAP